MRSWGLEDLPVVLLDGDAKVVGHGGEADGTLGDSSSRREGEECRKEEASHTLSVRDFAPFGIRRLGEAKGS